MTPVKTLALVALVLALLDRAEPEKPGTYDLTKYRPKPRKW